MYWISSMEFKNKVALVIGASSGIGAVVAIAFSAAGANVAMVGRNEAKLTEVAAKCNKPLTLIADVTIDDDVKRIVDQTIKKYGQLDVLVNVAGMSYPAHIMEGGDSMMKSYDIVMNTNLRGLIHMTSVAAPHLAKTKGNVVNIASVGALVTPIYGGLINYYTSKAAVIHFSACAAAELAPHGIRVNTVSPGPVRTGFLDNNNINGNWEEVKSFTALNRVSEPEEIAELVLFLASDKAKGVTGSNFLSDNGYKVKRK